MLRFVGFELILWFFELDLWNYYDFFFINDDDLYFLYGMII